MSLLDKASLIVTPNAYEESKLYSVVPNTTLGDMNVVRATTATRVNSAGLIEVVPRNLFTNSEQIDTADWVRQGVSATANQAISPNGTLTAELLDDGTAASTQHWIFQNPSLLNGTTYTISFYAKYISRKFIAVNIFNGLASQYVYYNIQDGLVSGSTGDVTASITSVGDNWFRITYTRPMATSGSAPNFRIGFADDTSNITYTGSNKQAYVWGFQIENFASATEYFPTTTRLNIPRIDYTNGSCPSLLVEPQRTNLLTYSNDFTNAIWTKDNVTLTSGVTSPSGVNNAFKLVESATTTVHSIYQTFVTLPSSVYSTSIYVKKGERFKVAVADRNTGIYVAFNLNTGTIIASNSLIGKIELLNNDWYRLTVTTSSAITVYVPQFFILEDSYTTGFPILQPYLGNATKGVFISFSQLEAGAYPTSYIPTVASTVTRNADVISKTGISSLIGQTEGTLFVEANLSVNANERRIITVSNGTESQRIMFWTDGTILYANFNNLSVTIGTFPIGIAKIALGYTISGGSTTYSIKLNNNTLITGTSATAPNPLSVINLGTTTGLGLILNDRINSVQLYKTRLTNSEITSLTAL